MMGNTETTANTNISQCSGQNLQCTWPADQTPQNIIYADVSRNKAHFKDVVQGNTIMCNDATFGDPSPTYGKQCYRRTRPSYGTSSTGIPMTTDSSGTYVNWLKCAQDGGTCSVNTTTDVLYGANGNYVSGYMPGGTSLQCNASTFANSIMPSPNNACYVLPGTTIGNQSVYNPPNMSNAPNMYGSPSTYSSPTVYSSPTAYNSPNMYSSPTAYNSPNMSNAPTMCSPSTQLTAANRINNGTPPTSYSSVMNTITGQAAEFYGWENVDFPGNNLVWTTKNSPENGMPVDEGNCAYQCTNTPNCNYYSYAPGNCYLKSVTPNTSNTSAKFLFGPI